MSDWQPIGTAPKNGTKLDLRSVHMEYGKSSSRRLINCVWFHNGWRCCGSTGIGTAIYYENGKTDLLTHWMLAPCDPS